MEQHAEQHAELMSLLQRFLETTSTTFTSVVYSSCMMLNNVERFLPILRGSRYQDYHVG